MRVPLNVGWLSENGLLIKACKMHGIKVLPETATHETIGYICDNGLGKLEWNDVILFTTSQLVSIGFQSE